ncbi:hypothetical protein [Dongia sedimenti]|uniref:Uncharacterized protein n=1 Tax=Dongia sedimenti TaxID=3064282 RepID=A0ABU0YV95_9PROT|nr:hypothetical protein [Rhodospirillaceae bacterium R-7]
MALADTDPDFGLLNGGNRSNLADQPFIPPRSSAFRTSLYPGWWSPGSTISTNPNPLAGDAPEAALSGGETGIPIAPPVEQSQQQTSFRAVQPSLGGQNDGGTSADERAANRAKEVGLAGEVTDPSDFLRAGALGLSLTSPTGIAGLAATTAANLLGAPDEATDPLGALLGDARGNPWDLRSNTNRRPGYSEEYDAGIKRGLSPQAALNAARSATDPGANTWGKSYSTQERTAAPPAPKAPSVTQQNAITGFQRAAAPANTGSGATGTPPRPQTPNVAPQFNVNAPAKTGGGAGASGASSGRSRGSDSWGSRGGTESRDSGSEGKFEAGGTVTNTPAMQQTRADNVVLGNVQQEGEDAARVPADQRTPDQQRAILRFQEAFGVEPDPSGRYGDRNAQQQPYAMGGAVTNEPPRRAVSQIQHADIGDIEQDEAPIDRGNAVPPEQDPRYNPPAEATDPRGVVDGVSARVTPGELVVRREAATAYTPAAKALINDPQMAPEIGQILDAFAQASGYASFGEIEDSSLVEAIMEAIAEAQAGGGAEMDDSAYAAEAYGPADDGVSDDNSGLGIAAPRGRLPVAASDPRTQLFAGRR